MHGHDSLATSDKNFAAYLLHCIRHKPREKLNEFFSKNKHETKTRSQQNGRHSSRLSFSRSFLVCLFVRAKNSRLITCSSINVTTPASGRGSETRTMSRWVGISSTSHVQLRLIILFYAKLHLWGIVVIVVIRLLNMAFSKPMYGTSIDCKCKCGQYARASNCSRKSKLHLESFHSLRS